LPTELAHFLLGAFSNRWWLPACTRYLAKQSHSRLPHLVTLLIVVMCAGYLRVPLAQLVRQVVFLGALAAALPLLFAFQNHSALDRSLGALSYPIYIGHVFVLKYIESLFPRMTELRPFVWSLINVAAAVAFGFLLDTCVAEPLEKYRAKVTRASAKPQRAAPIVL